MLSPLSKGKAEAHKELWTWGLNATLVPSAFHLGQLMSLMYELQLVKADPA